jgi:hypothetical protein
MRTSRSDGLTSLTAMMRRSRVVAVWRVKPARVVYGHFYFSMSEALLRDREWQRQRTCPHWRFPLLDSPAA